MLSKLLSKLQDQVTEDQFTYSVAIVDNDSSQSAKSTVTDWQTISAIQIDYYCEQEQNIALARNKAVENAKGNFIAFIDDDEFPENTWLLKLYKALSFYHADGILGPVKPYYPANTPTWLIKSKLCERCEHKTGTILHWGQTRTGNTLLNIRLFKDKTFWFESEYGRTGGEDTIFFKKHHENGKVFIWCNEALVYETVPPARWSKKFHIRNNLRMGCVLGDNLRRQVCEFHCSSKKKALTEQLHVLSKSTIWIISMTFLLPLSILCGQHFYMYCKTKLMYNLGILSGFFGYVIIRYRD